MKSNKNINYDSILRRFTTDELSRFSIHTPFLVGNWSAATNGHFLCAVDQSVFKRNDYATEQVPNIDVLWTQAPWLKPPLKVKISKLVNADLDSELAQLPPKPVKPRQRYATCKACTEGNCICRCRGVHSCSKCHGNKQVETTASKNAVAKFYRDEQRYKDAFGEKPTGLLKGIPFDYQYLKTICQAAQAVGQSTLTITALGADKILVAEAGQLRFALMPMRYPTARLVELYP